MWIQTCLVASCALVLLSFAQASDNAAPSHIVNADIHDELLAVPGPAHPLVKRQTAAEYCPGYDYFCWKCYYFCYANGVCDVYCYWWCSNNEDCSTGRKKRSTEVLERVTRDQHGHVAPIPYSFEFFDVHELGCITINELAEMLPGVSVDSPGLKKSFELTDTDKSGCIDKPEFESAPFVFANGQDSA